MPPELDFFKYAEGGQPKRKNDGSGGPKAKKQKVEDTKYEEDIPQPGPSMTRQRVTAKGPDVPAPVGSFEDLASRYNVSSFFLGNLEKCGYHEPTGIQAHGVPILLEVRV